MAKETSVQKRRIPAAGNRGRSLRTSQILVTAVHCALLAARVSAEPLPARPNVILFLVDDLGWMDTSVYGSTYYETPHIDRLAAQGMRFTDAHAVPQCSPTRASILTGQYSARHGITAALGHMPPAEAVYAESGPNHPMIYVESKTYLDPKLVTLAEVLQDNGYRTGHFGKWHLGLMQEHWPEEHGFETTWHASPDYAAPSYFSPYRVRPHGVPLSGRLVGNITDGPKGEYITDRLTDEALEFIDEHHDELFFLNLWHYGVHGPWGHKSQYTAEFVEKTDPRGKQGNPIMASMIRSIDESLGRVMDKLNELGLAENTLLIFYSDNGGDTHSNTPGSRQMNRSETHPWYSRALDWQKWAVSQPPTNNAPLRDGKGRIYEGGQRVPLIVRWPARIEGDTISDTLVGSIDLYPTILEAIGLQQPHDHIIDGQSFLSVLEQTAETNRESYFTWLPRKRSPLAGVSVRQGDWKLIRRFEPHPSEPSYYELYNLKTDLGETTNLAPENPDKVAHLGELIDTFIKETGAIAPKPNPAYEPKPAHTTTTSSETLDGHSERTGGKGRQGDARPLEGQLDA